MKRLALITCLLASPAAADSISFPSPLYPLVPMLGQVAGNWYESGNTVRAGTTFATSLTVCTPILFASPITIDQLGIVVGTAHAGNMQLAIYATDPAKLRPGTMLGNTGSISTAGATSVSGAFSGGSGSNVSIAAPGVYWTCLQYDASAGGSSIVESANNGGLASFYLGSSSLANVTGGGIVSVSTVAVFGTWPNYSSSTVWTDGLFGTAPYVVYHILSIP